MVWDPTCENFGSCSMITKSIVSLPSWPLSVFDTTTC